MTLRGICAHRELPLARPMQQSVAQTRPRTANGDNGATYEITSTRRFRNHTGKNKFAARANERCTSLGRSSQGVSRTARGAVCVARPFACSGSGRSWRATADVIHGFYYDGWKPTSTPVKFKTAQEFYDAVKSNFTAQSKHHPNACGGRAAIAYQTSRPVTRVALNFSASSSRDLARTEQTVDFPSMYDCSVTIIVGPR